MIVEKNVYKYIVLLAIAGLWYWGAFGNEFFEQSKIVVIWTCSTLCAVFVVIENVLFLIYRRRLYSVSMLIGSIPLWAYVILQFQYFIK